MSDGDGRYDPWPPRPPLLLEFPVPFEAYFVNILAWERRPIFYRSPATLSRTTVLLASVLGKLKEYYERQPDQTPGGRSLPLSGKYVRDEYSLDTDNAKRVAITCAVTVGGWHPPTFKDHLVIGLKLIEEQVWQRGAVAMRAEVGLGQDRYVNFEARLDILSAEGRMESIVMG